MDSYTDNFVSVSCPTNQLQFPKLKTNHLITEYYDSKSFKIPITSKVPEATSVELELLKSKIVKRDAVETLKEAQKVNVVVAKDLDKRWSDLKEKQLKFRKTIVSFDQFIKANADKRERTKQKIADDKVHYETRCVEIEKLRLKMNQFYFIKGRREEMIKSYRKYENFLEAVCSKDFKNVNQILLRYDSLIENKNVIREQQSNLLVSMQNAKKEFLNLMTSKHMRLMELTGILSMLQLRHENAKTKALKWETVNNKIKEQVLKMERSLELVLTKVNYMYSDMCARNTSVVCYPKLSLEDKLNFIQHYMKNMETIIAGLSKWNKKPGRTKSILSNYG